MKSLITLLSIFALTVSGNDTSQQIVEANNRFAPDIYTQVVKIEPGNIVISPLSAETVLALLYFGCKESTAEELRKALYLPDDQEKIRLESKTLLAELQSNNNINLTFEIANGIFIQQGFCLKNCFLNVAKDDFYATTQNVNFSKAQKAADVINKYVEDHTHKLIKNLVSPDALSAATKVVLVNALHFKSNWSHQFSERDTTKNNFYKTPTNIVLVDTLHHFNKHFNYYECHDLNAEFLELPFKEEDASMIIALPKTHSGLSTLEKRIVDVFTYNIPFKVTYLNVALPKFKVETKIDFKKVLKAIGVNKIFDGSQADLSGISGKKGDLIVSQVVQKAFIDLNKGGVEAAAATYVSIELLSAIVGDNPAKNFIANRPFIYLLKYKKTIIFAGKVTEPKY